MNLFSTLTDHLDAGQPFLVTDDRTWSFGDVLAASERVAASLRNALVAPGDRVVVIADKSPYTVATYLACLRIGAAYVPLNPAYTDSEIAFLVEDAQPSAVITRTGHPHRNSFTLRADGSGTLLETDDRYANTIERSDDDIAAILYTSGTTGRSKGAMLTHGCLRDNAVTLHKAWHWQNNEVLLHALPIFHVHGLFVALHCALLSSAKVFFLAQFDVTQVRRLLPEANVMMGVPTYYSRLVAEPSFGAADCENVRLFISGSAPLTENVFSEFTRRTGHTLLERYGMTEAGMICSNPYDGERVAGTVGFPLPGYVARVADSSDTEVSRGDVGVLQIRGPSLFAGYWQLPDKTADEFTGDGYFRTGDLASMDAEGRVTLLGRSHDLIITGGFNVYPKEVERVINEVPGVDESAVVGLADTDLGEVPCAYIVGTADEHSITAHVAEHLARYKQPRMYRFVDSLPRNAMGKVQKSRLRD